MEGHGVPSGGVMLFKHFLLDCGGLGKIVLLLWQNDTDQEMCKICCEKQQLARQHTRYQQIILYLNSRDVPVKLMYP